MASKHTNKNLFFQEWQYMLSTSICVHYIYLDNYTGIWLPNIESALKYQLIYTVHSLYTCWLPSFFQISTSYLKHFFYKTFLFSYLPSLGPVLSIRLLLKSGLSSVLKYSYRPLRTQAIFAQDCIFMLNHLSYYANNDVCLSLFMTWCVMIIVVLTCSGPGNIIIYKGVFI